MIKKTKKNIYTILKLFINSNKFKNKIGGFPFHSSPNDFLKNATFHILLNAFSYYIQYNTVTQKNQ